MGDLKNKKQNKPQQFQLDDFEYDFIAALARARNDSYSHYQDIISTFLSYLAGTKWGITTDQLVDFELDDAARTVKVSPHKES